MHSPVGLLVTVGFLVGALGSVPLALATLLLARRVQSFSRALSYAGGGVGVVVVTLAAAVATITPEAGVVLVIVAAVLGVVLWGVPLLIARWVLVRTGLTPEQALRNATIGLPVALLSSLPLVFGDFSRYNITFLTGVEAVAAWTTLALVVLVGPAVVGLLVARSQR